MLQGCNTLWQKEGPPLGRSTSPGKSVCFSLSLPLSVCAYIYTDTYIHMNYDLYLYIYTHIPTQLLPGTSAAAIGAQKLHSEPRNGQGLLGTRAHLTRLRQAWEDFETWDYPRKGAPFWDSL